MKPPITDADRDAIVAAYLAGEPVKKIAHRFGVGIGLPTYLAKRRGHPMRQKRKKGVVRAEVGRALKTRLEMAARRQNTKPDIIVREALAAYLGGPSL